MPEPGRIRVLQVGKFYPPYRGGMENHLESLCQSLKNKIDIEVIVSNTAPRTAVEIKDGVQIQRLGRLFNFSAAPICPSLISTLYSTNADIVHIHWPNPAAV